MSAGRAHLLKLEEDGERERERETDACDSSMRMYKETNEDGKNDTNVGGELVE